MNLTKPLTTFQFNAFLPARRRARQTCLSCAGTAKAQCSRCAGLGQLVIAPRSERRVFNPVAQALMMSPRIKVVARILRPLLELEEIDVIGQPCRFVCGDLIDQAVSKRRH